MSSIIVINFISLDGCLHERCDEQRDRIVASRRASVAASVKNFRRDLRRGRPAGRPSPNLALVRSTF